MATETSDTVGETVSGSNVLPKLPEHLRTPKPFDIQSARERDAAIKAFCTEFLLEGEDYQKLEFHDKPVLSKSGAEKLVIFCGIEPRIAMKDETLDWTGKDHGGEPFFYALYRYTFYVDGKVVGEGEGSANSWEEKHRFRWVQENRIPPGIDKATLPTRGGTLSEYEWAIERAQTSGKYGKPVEYWERFRKSREDGTARLVTKKDRSGKDELSIEIDSTVYRIPNETSPDVVNTTQKMAQKRGFICTTIIATGVSGRFTQDIDDMPPEMFQDRPRRDPKPAATKATAPKTTSAPTTTVSSAAPKPSTKAELPVAERLKAMVVKFEELRPQCHMPWYRRRLGFAEPDSLDLERGIELYKEMREYITLVGQVSAARDAIPEDDYKRALYDAGVSDLWEFGSLKDLQGFASTLQLLQGVSA